MTWGTPVQSFVFLGLLVFELEPTYATSDRQTDDGRRSPLNAPAPPTGWGHNNFGSLFEVVANRNRSGPNLAHMNRSGGDNVNKIFGTTSPVRARRRVQTSPAQQVFCTPNQTTFRQPSNGHSACLCQTGCKYLHPIRTTTARQLSAYYVAESTEMTTTSSYYYYYIIHSYNKKQLGKT